MRKFAYISILAIVVAACGGTAVVENTGIQTVSPVAAESVLEASGTELTVLDVRTPEEYAAGHLANAINLDFYAADFSSRLGDLDPNAQYVLYCQSGNRSGSTVEMMRELGFSDVVEVDGGLVAWEQSGLPVVR